MQVLFLSTLSLRGVCLWVCSSRSPTICVCVRHQSSSFLSRINSPSKRKYPDDVGHSLPVLLEQTEQRSFVYMYQEGKDPAFLLQVSPYWLVLARKSCLGMRDYKSSSHSVFFMKGGYVRQVIVMRLCGRRDLRETALGEIMATI